MRPLETSASEPDFSDSEEIQIDTST